MFRLDRKGVPVLLKEYLELGAELVAFQVDRRFADALDGLIAVDLRKTDTRALEPLHGPRRRSEVLEGLVSGMRGDLSHPPCEISLRIRVFFNLFERSSLELCW